MKTSTVVVACGRLGRARTACMTPRRRPHSNFRLQILAISLCLRKGGHSPKRVTGHKNLPHLVYTPPPRAVTKTYKGPLRRWTPTAQFSHCSPACVADTGGIQRGDIGRRAARHQALFGGHGFCRELRAHPHRSRIEHQGAFGQRCGDFVGPAHH